MAPLNLRAKHAKYLARRDTSRSAFVRVWQVNRPLSFDLCAVVRSCVPLKTSMLRTRHTKTQVSTDTRSFLCPSSRKARTRLGWRAYC